MPTVDTSWSFRPFRAVILENQSLRVVVLPELGGRIWSILAKSYNRELLWHNPRIPPQTAPFGAVFDNVWCGGWEEMFPSPAPSVINGESYPDHGEVWCVPWHSETSCDSGKACVLLSCDARISAVRLEKRITLHGEGARVQVSYFLHNPTGVDFPFIFTLHPAFAAPPGTRIDFPPMTVELDPTYPGTLTGVPSPFVWPHADRKGNAVDLRQVAPPSSGEVYFFYGRDFKEGWCALTDPADRFTWGLVFSPTFFRSCWMFSSYGGWRNHHLAILEPSTSFPQQVENAIRNKTAAVLPAGGTLETSVVLQVQGGLTHVKGLTPEGEFRS
ncbi:MAG: DUF5107 domain-containing protein [Terriglobia bacterium]